MKTTTLLRDDTHRRRIDAMARVFTKSNRVLTGLPVICTVVDDPNQQAPSWTDGKSITFNLAVIGNVATVEDIIRLTGLDLHEVAHVLYTQRRGSLVDAVRSEGMHNAYNMLEDQRIETLLTAKYPSAIAYLVSTFMRFCLMHESSWEANFPLMHGRYYLPKDVRAEFRRRFARQDLIPAFVSIIDEYRKLILPLDSARALELVRDYHALLVDMSGSGLEPEDPNGHTCGRPVTVDTGKPVTEQEQQTASELSDAYDDIFDDDDDDDDDTGSVRDDDADPANNAPSDPDDDGDDMEGDDDGDSVGGGKGDSADADADDADASGRSGMADDGLTSDQPGDGIGSTPMGSNHAPMDDQSVRDMLEDFAKAYEELDEVQEDALNKQQSIVRGNGEITTRLPAGKYRNLPVDPDTASAVRQFTKELDRLRADSDPGWATHRSSGRINVKRAVQGAPLHDLWDQWDAGHNDACDIECVIIVDDSGSMSGYEIEQASRAMWVIKRALEKVDASVTVLTFGEESLVVYGPRDKASRGTYKAITANGSCTLPREAVIEAVRILTNTRRSNRIFIAITDGQWDHDRGDAVSPLTVDQLIPAMGERGITTAIANIGRSRLSSHGCQVSMTINDASDLAKFAEGIVAQSIIQKGK